MEKDRSEGIIISNDFAVNFSHRSSSRMDMCCSEMEISPINWTSNQILAVKINVLDPIFQRIFSLVTSADIQA